MLVSQAPSLKQADPTSPEVGYFIYLSRCKGVGDEMNKPDIQALSIISFGLIMISTIILLLFIFFALRYQVTIPCFMIPTGILTSLFGIILGLFAFWVDIFKRSETRTKGLGLSCLGALLGTLLFLCYFRILWMWYLSAYLSS